MPDQSEQFDPPSRWKRFITSPFGRIGVAVVLIAFVGAIAYFVFGLVSGGPARLTLTSQIYNYRAGDTIVVNVLLDSANQPVTAVGAYVQYDPRWLTFVTARAGGGWTNPTPTLLVNDVPDVGPGVGEAEVIVGQPSPGIVSSSSNRRTVAVLEFRANSSLPDPQGGTTQLTFNQSTTVVVKDDAGGTDIAGRADPLTLTVFPPSVNESTCLSAHPTADVCRADEYCPSPYPGTGLNTEDPACCQVQCLQKTNLTIDEASIIAEVVGNSSNNYSVTIKWRTNLPSSGRVDYWDQANSTQLRTGGDINGSYAVEHAVLLGTDFQEGATFGFRVTSAYDRTDGAPPCSSPTDCLFATSNEHTFSVVISQQRRLEIFDLTARAVSNTSVVISFTTNAPASSEIICDGCGTIAEPARTTIHSVRVSGLTPNTLYEFRVVATADPAGYAPGRNIAIAQVNAKTKNLTIEDDANVILKVERDRVCDTWLSCTSYLQVKNKSGKIENMCFALAECDALNPVTGACMNLRSDPQVSRFVTVYNDAQASTVDLAKNLSGNSQAELELRGFTSGTAASDEKYADAKIPGVGSFGALPQYGSSVTVPNGTFDVGLGVYPWSAYPEGASSAEAVFDYAAGGIVLKAIPSPLTTTLWGVKVPLGKNALQSGSLYYLSLHVKAPLKVTDGKVPPSTTLTAEIAYDGYRRSRVLNSLQTFSAGDGWQQVVVGPFIPPTGGLGEVYLGIFVDSNVPSANQPTSFSIDDVSINPVLGVGSGLMIPRVCRGYPTSSSPACDYFDPFSGRAFRGWKGYCLVPDPKDDPAEKEGTRNCLQWWPVDVISGTASAFSFDPGAGYLAQGGRFPLYYCVEAEGNYPYVTTFQNPLAGGGTGFIPPLVGFSFLRASGDPIFLNTYTADGARKFPPTFSPFLNVPVSSIAYIEVPWNNGDPEHVFVLTPQNGWAAWRVNGADCPAVNSWDEFFKYSTDSVLCQGIPNDNCDMNGIRFTFDEQSERLKTIQYGGCDDSPDSGHTSINSITYYRREACSVVAQVVDPFGRNAAQSGRVTAQKYQVPGVKYGYNTDYRPFGAAVHPDPDYDPTAMDENGNPAWGKLFIEPPSAEVFSEEPFQVRGGSPYGLRQVDSTNDVLTGYCQNNIAKKCDLSSANPDEPCQGDPPPNQTCERVCIFNACNDNEPGWCSETFTPCMTPTDCVNDTTPRVCVGTASPQGIGSKTCITGQFRGKTCTNHFDCGQLDDGTNGFCTGIEKPKDVADWGLFGGILRTNPAQRLGSLFVKTYGTWQWIAGQYRKICDEGGQPVCTNGSRKGQTCTLGTGIDPSCGSCGYVETQSSSDLGTGRCGPNTSIMYGWDATMSRTEAGRFGVEPIAPSVANMKINERLAGEQTEFSASGQYPVALSFTSHVDGNQLPLVGYSIDWGDGEVSSEGDLSIAPKSNPKDPHRLGHVYRYFEPTTPYPFGCTKDVDCNETYLTHGCTTTQCSYQLRVQIEDNWGWCSGNTTVASCGLNSTIGWTSFDKNIIVRNQ